MTGWAKLGALIRLTSPCPKQPPLTAPHPCFPSLPPIPNPPASTQPQVQQIRGRQELEARFNTVMEKRREKIRVSGGLCGVMRLTGGGMGATSGVGTGTGMSEVHGA